MSEKSLPRRAALEAAPSWLEDAAKGVGIGVSGHLPVSVTARRNEDTRQGTASGNYRSGDIAAGPRRDPPPRRQLDRPVPSARSTPPRGLISSAVARGVGRRRQDQEQPGTIGLVSLRGVPEPVVSDLVKAARQDVLEEVPEELDARQPLDAHASAQRSFQRKVTWVWSMPRIRAC